MTDRHDIGGNKPPSLETIIAERFREAYPDVHKRKDDLLASAENIPAELDAKTASKAATFIAQLRQNLNAMEAARVELKDPYLKGGKAVDAFFKGEKAAIEGERSKVQKRLTAWQVAEEEKARKAAEEKARKEREAREAEERRQREIAEAEARRQREEAEKAIAEAQTEADLERAAEVEEQAREAEAEAAAPIVEPEPEPVRPVEAPRVESEFGHTASLRKVWKCTGFDPQTIDLNAVRPYLKQDAIQKALNLAVRQGIRKVEGATIEEVPESRVR